MSAGTWRLAPGVVRLDGHRLAGGTPFRVVRLSERGDDELARLLGTTGDPASSVAALADRLLQGGILLGPPKDAVPVDDVTVVIPARATSPAVEQVLDAVPADVPVVVVDDGSRPPLVLADRAGLTVLRHDRSRGPAAARNAGADRASTRWLAFVDADVVPGPGWLGLLLAHAGAPDVLAVAPRVVSAPTPGWAGLVETWSGALDLGATPSDVGPGRRVSFVPTALLVVDRAAFADLGGFDESMHVGEDVDLVRRLGDRGRVRYEPDVVAVHTPRATLSAVLRRRYVYGTSAADLDRRRPGSIRHAEVSVWSFVPWVLAVVVHPVAGLVAGAATVAIAPYGIRELPPADARRLAARGHLLSAAGMGRYLVRPLWPVTVLALLAIRRRRLVIAAAVGVGTVDAVRRWVQVDRREPVSLLAAGKVVVASVLDDAAYSAGVWAGCLRRRTLGPLLPRVTGIGRPLRRRRSA